MMGTRDIVGRVRTSLLEAGAPRSRTAVAVGLPTAAVLSAEGLLFVGQVRLALGVYLATFVGCSLGPLVADRYSAVFRAFLLLPLFRLLNLGLPVFIGSTLSWLPLVYGGFLVTTYVVASDLPGVSLPGRDDTVQTITLAPLAIVLGVVLASIEFAILRPTGLLDAWGGPATFNFVVVIVVFVTFTEEFLFRGIIQSTVAERIGGVGGVLLSAVLYGAMHSPQGIAAEVVFGVGVGLVYGLVYYRTRNLLLVTLVHGTLNVLLFGLFPISGPVFGF